MGFFKKLGKIISKPFRVIGKHVKKQFKRFGKFMGRIGIVGQIAMMFILPGVGAALAKGFGALWSGVIGQTAAQGAAAAAATGAATTAAATAGGASAAAAAASGATAAAGVSTAASGLLGSSNAILRGAGMVLEKGAQFARTIQAGYKTVSQAVTGVFTETGKWIGGKLGMKTAEGAAMKGTWANYSKGVTDSFAKLGDKAAEFWSPITDVGKVGGNTAIKLPTIGTNAVEAAKATTAELAGKTTTEVASSNIYTDIDTMSTTELKSQIAKGAESTFTPPTGFDVADPLNLERPPSLLDRAKDYITETPERLYKGAIDFVAQTPGRVLKSEATGALYDAVGLTPEPMDIEGPSSYGYRPSFYQSNANVLANTMPNPNDFGAQIGGLIVPPNETGYYGAQSIDAYKKRISAFTDNPNTGVPT